MSSQHPLLSLSRPSVSAFVALLCVGIAGCGEAEPRPIEELVHDGSIFLDPETMEPYTGTVFSTFDDQPLVVAERASLRDGAYDGPYEAFFENRQLSSKEIYAEGRRHGPYEWYFDSGQLYERGTYLNGSLEGPYEAYWESGEIYETGTYRDGRFDGARAWYLNGELIELVTYVNGVIQGPYERYTSDGAIDLQGTLRDGQPCGRWVEAGMTTTYAPCSVTTD